MGFASAGASGGAAQTRECNDGDASHRMKLKNKIWLLLGALVGLVLIIDLSFGYRKLAAEMRSEAEYHAAPYTRS